MVPLLRVFVAVDLNDKTTIEHILEFQKEILQTGADVKLVEEENLHFTLKFIGEVNEYIIKEIDSRLRKLSLNQVEINLRGSGCFPSISFPRVVWVGVEEQCYEEIISLANSVLSLLEGLGKEGESFTPHLTVARVRSGKNKEKLIKLIETNKDRQFGKLRISEIKLKSSILRPSGPVYSDLEVYRLL